MHMQGGGWGGGGGEEAAKMTTIHNNVCNDNRPCGEFCRKRAGQKNNNDWPFFFRLNSDFSFRALSMYTCFSLGFILFHLRASERTARLPERAVVLDWSSNLCSWQNSMKAFRGFFSSFFVLSGEPEYRIFFSVNKENTGEDGGGGGSSQYSWWVWIVRKVGLLPVVLCSAQLTARGSEKERERGGGEIERYVGG